MKLVTVNDMRELEKTAFDEYKVPSLVMMENAAQGFCEELKAALGDLSGKRVNIFCGSGNNGGDGFAISRLLCVRGAYPKVFVGFNLDKLKGDARINYELAVKFGIPVSEFSGLIDECDIAVDALYGTGFHGEISGEEVEMVRYMNNCGAFVAAVDMPSGAGADNGTVSKNCVKADLTVTFGAAKVGQFLYPAKKYVGKLLVAPISIPGELLKEHKSNIYTLDKSVFSLMPERAEDAHKGSFGKVLVFAGSKGMCGAAVMASEATLKSGAGMATLATPKCVADIAASKLTEVMTAALPVDGDTVSKTAVTILSEKLKEQDILLMGPGLSGGENVKSIVMQLATESKKPMIIDADALNALKGNINILKKKKAPAVLTPHPVEFSRISGHSIEEIKGNRITLARNFAKEFDVTLVLKGADTLVCCPDGRVFINTISNSGMATAGSGDVLAGIIAGIAAQGADLCDAACLGAYIHTVAGSLASKKKGEYGMTAVDILNEVPFAIKEVLTDYKE